jgi:hypothetical protein
MAPPQYCPSYAFGRRLRVTRLDGCGNPVVGPKSQVVTRAFTEVAISPNILTGDEITVKNAGGELCISDKALDSIKWLNIKITMCSQDPDLISILNPTYFQETDEAGSAIGFRMDTSQTYDAAFAVELWTDVTGVNLCSQSAEAPPGAQVGQWGYMLLPFCQGGSPGDLAVSNKELLTVWNGRTLPNAQWGVGPWPVRYDMTQSPWAPRPLRAPVASTQPLVFFLTTLAPPQDQCGAQPVPATVLPAPSGLEFLSATGTTLSASWNQVPGALGYTMTVVQHGTTTPVFTTTVPPTALQATVSGLTAATNYDVTITADGDGSTRITSVASSVVAMSTLPQLATPTVSSTTPAPTQTSFNVSFPAVANAVGYTATAVKTGTTTPVFHGTITPGSPNVASFSGGGIAGGNAYTVSVVALGDNIAYANSNAGTQSMTTAALIALSAPSGLTVPSGTITATGAQASWTAVANASSYTAATTVTSGGAAAGTTTVGPPNTATAATVTGLTTVTGYTISVTAVGDGITYANGTPATQTFTTH